MRRNLTRYAHTVLVVLGRSGGVRRVVEYACTLALHLFLHQVDRNAARNEQTATDTEEDATHGSILSLSVTKVQGPTSLRQSN